MSAIYGLWLRELQRYFRSRTQIIASMGQPLLYLLALGFGFGPVFAKAGQGSYLQFLAPGVIGMTVLFSGAFSGIGLLMDRQFGFLKETFVAPVPRTSVMLGRILGCSTVAVIQGLLVLIACLIAGFRPVDVPSVAAPFLTMSLIALVFCAMGSVIGSRLQNMQEFSLAMNFLVMPLYFLSGALFPLQGLPAPMRIIAAINPLSYGIDALRGSLTGATYFGLTLDWGVLSAVVGGLLLLSVYSFSRIEL